MRGIYIKIATSSQGWSVARDLEAYRTSLVLTLSHNKKYYDTLLQTFVDLTEYDDTNVRLSLSTIAALFIPLSQGPIIQKRIIPWMNTLSRDSQRSVRIASVQAYGSLLEFGGRDREIFEKIEIQLSSFLDDPLPVIKLDALLVFANKALCLDESIRESFLFPTLLRWTTMDLRAKKVMDDGERLTRLQLCLAAIQVFHAYRDTYLPEHTVVQHILPSLTLINKELPVLALEDKSVVGRSRSGTLFTPTGSKANMAIPSPGIEQGDAMESVAEQADKSSTKQEDEQQMFNDAIRSCRSIVTELIFQYTQNIKGRDDSGRYRYTPSHYDLLMLICTM